MFCDKRYRNEHSLKKHISKKHAESAEWVQCLKCFKPVPSKEEMQNHLCELVRKIFLKNCFSLKILFFLIRNKKKPFFEKIFSEIFLENFF